MTIDDSNSQGAKLEDFCDPSCPFRQAEPVELDGSELESWRDRRTAHLFGHMLNYIAASSRDLKLNGIPQDGIEAELRIIYNDLNNPHLTIAQRSSHEAAQEAFARLPIYGPEMRGCIGAAAESELMAEAFRAYMQDPNAMKTSFPNTALRIREWVNTCSKLNKNIHLN